jgi:TRAP-type uncharacterized transport system substrate-binding protein
MVTTGALIHGDRQRFLRFDPVEQPVALQLGGSDPADLARMQEVFPDGYISTVPPLPAFAGVNVPTPVLSYDNMLVTNEGVSDELIFSVLDAIANNKEALAAGVALFGGMNPDALYKDTIVTPYHPAAREWQERRAAAQ